MICKNTSMIAELAKKGKRIGQRAKGKGAKGVYEIVVGSFSPRHRRWLAWIRMVVWMGAVCPHPHHHPRTCELPQGSEVSPGLMLENSCTIYNYFIHLGKGLSRIIRNSLGFHPTLMI